MVSGETWTSTSARAGRRGSGAGVRSRLRICGVGCGSVGAGRSAVGGADPFAAPVGRSGRPSTAPPSTRCTRPIARTCRGTRRASAARITVRPRQDGERRSPPRPRPHDPLVRGRWWRTPAPHLSRANRPLGRGGTAPTHRKRPRGAGSDGELRGGGAGRLGGVRVAVGSRDARGRLRRSPSAGSSVRVFAARVLDFPPLPPRRTADAQAGEFVAAVRAADAVVVASPGYHGIVSGLVKNALDYLEELRSDERPYLHGRPVGLVAVAGGWQAAVGTLGSLRAGRARAPRLAHAAGPGDQQPGHRVRRRGAHGRRARRRVHPRAVRPAADVQGRLRTTRGPDRVAPRPSSTGRLEGGSAQAGSGAGPGRRARSGARRGRPAPTGRNRSRRPPGAAARRPPSSRARRRTR